VPAWQLRRSRPDRLEEEIRSVAGEEAAEQTEHSHLVAADLAVDVLQLADDVDDRSPRQSRTWTSRSTRAMG